MTMSNEDQQELPTELLNSLNEARVAIAQQRYAKALAILRQGLDRKYDSAALDGVSLVADAIICDQCIGVCNNILLEEKE